MQTGEQPRIWIIPQKFWAATRNMQPEQADSLFQKVSELAERHDIDGLRHYDFVHIGRLKRATITNS